MEQPKQDILLETGTNEVEIAEFGIYLRGKEHIKQSFGINVAKIREIIKTPNFIRIPETNQHVLGVFKLRDKIIPLINLSSWLNEETENFDLSRSFVIVTEFNKTNFGFLIHDIKTIHRMSWDKVLPPASVSSSINTQCITGVVLLQEKIMMMIDFEKIVADINPELSLKVNRDKAIIEDVQQVAGKKPKVMIAEDSSMMRDLLTGILAQGGFEVVQFNNGREAWDAINRTLEESSKSNKKLSDYVQLLITDIEMPQMDGHSLCRKIKETAGLKDLPVVLFSSLIYDEIRRKGEMIGADAQISKPDIGNLLSLVRDLLKKKYG